MFLLKSIKYVANMVNSVDYKEPLNTTYCGFNSSWDFRVRIFIFIGFLNNLYFFPRTLIDFFYQIFEKIPLQP